MKQLIFQGKRKYAGYMAGVLAALGVCSACVTTAWALPQSGTSVSGNVRVRDEAVGGAQVGSLAEGQEVTITGETTGSDGNTWYAITFEQDGQQQEGWIRSDLLHTGEDAGQEDASASETETDTQDTAEETQDTAEETQDTAEETQDTADGTSDAAETGTVHVELASGYVDLTDVPEDVAAQVSDRFVESACVLADGTVPGYQLAAPDALVSDDALLTNFYYLYGINDLGEGGWYLYDASQGSLQKSILDMSYSLTDAQEDDSESQDAALFESNSQVRMIVAVLALVCVLLLILTIVFSVRYRRMRAMLEREESGETEKTGENGPEPKRAPEPMEILDLDDMDEADYEALLEQYLDTHIETEPENAKQETEPENIKQKTEPPKPDEDGVDGDDESAGDDAGDGDGAGESAGDDAGDDDLEFL